MPPNLRIRQADNRRSFIYEAFCYKAWSLVEFISRTRLKDETAYKTIVQWIVAYHKVWLDRNPYVFISKQFWDICDNTRDQPLAHFRPRMLPRTESKPSRPGTDRYTDSVDWDRVADDYSNWILGPLASVMVTPDPRKSNKIRNVLITRLLDLPDLKQMRILDYGCGPGNLLEVISEKVGKIYGLDISDRALAIASEKAANLGLDFEAVKRDMRTYVSDEKFDVIVSINSLLPTKRADIALMLKNVRENLAPNGRFLAIVPSFDTCVALAEYWEESYKEHSKNHKHVKLSAAAFKAAKKMDKETLSFADDGVHVQCFHTKESIEKEFPEAGLQIVGNLEKVEYPWEYARDFDYGYFLHKPEIWDWFVEAVKGPDPQSSPSIG